MIQQPDTTNQMGVRPAQVATTEAPKKTWSEWFSSLNPMKKTPSQTGGKRKTKKSATKKSANKKSKKSKTNKKQ